MPVRITERRHFNILDVPAAAGTAAGTGAAPTPAVAVAAMAGSGTVTPVGAALDASVTVTGEQRLLVGVRTPGSGTPIATEETLIGADLDLQRTYDSGFSTNFMSSTGSQDVTPGRVTVYSFKPSIATLAAGTTLNANINTLLASIPAGHKTAIGIWHEPEDNTSGSHGGADPAGFTYAQYRSAYQRFADLVHATGRSELKVIWIMMAYSWKLSSNRDPDLWYPGDSYVDLVGIDAYNEGSLSVTQRWDSPGFEYGEPDPTESLGSAGGGYIHGGFISWVTARNKPFIVCESGSIRRLSGTRPQWSINNNVPYTKAGWISYAAEFWASQPLCAGALYFDFNGRDWAGSPAESWELGNDTTGADYAAWGAVATKYGYRANGEAVAW